MDRRPNISHEARVLPFSPDQFPADFTDYNAAIWPIQIAAYGGGLLAMTGIPRSIAASYHGSHPYVAVHPGGVPSSSRDQDLSRGARVRYDRELNAAGGGPHPGRSGRLTFAIRWREGGNRTVIVMASG